MRPYYEDSHVRLYLGDNCEVLEQLDTTDVDLLLSDPPYGINWKTNYTHTYDQDRGQFEHTPWTFNRHQWRGLQGDQTPFDPTPWLHYPQVILWGANCYSHQLPKGTWLIWDKRFKSGKSFKNSDGEAAWRKGGYGIRIYAQTWQGICRSHGHATERHPRGGGNPSLHPTQKPVALGQWCIRQAHGVQRLLDPYAGSGSFLIAAKALNLQAIGIEIEEAYCETAARRLEQTVVEVPQP